MTLFIIYCVLGTLMALNEYRDNRCKDECDLYLPLPFVPERYKKPISCNILSSALAFFFWPTYTVLRYAEARDSADRFSSVIAILKWVTLVACVIIWVDYTIRFIVWVF